MSWRALAGRAILTFRVVSSGDYKEEMPFGEARRFASTPLIRASLPSGAHGASRLRHAGGDSHAAPERSGDRRESPRGTRGGARGRLPSVLQPPHVATKGDDGNLSAQAANGLAARRERRGGEGSIPVLGTPNAHRARVGATGERGCLRQDRYECLRGNLP